MYLDLKIELNSIRVKGNNCRSMISKTKISGYAMGVSNATLTYSRSKFKSSLFLLTVTPVAKLHPFRSTIIIFYVHFVHSYTYMIFNIKRFEKCHLRKSPSALNSSSVRLTCQRLTDMVECYLLYIHDG